MSSTALNVVYASLGLAGLMAVACLVDLILEAPFGGQTVFDILCILAAAITGYMGVTCLKDA